MQRAAIVPRACIRDNSSADTRCPPSSRNGASEEHRTPTFPPEFFPLFSRSIPEEPRIGRDDPFVDEVRQILLPIFTRISPEYLEDSRTSARNRNNDREIEFIRVIRSRISRVCLFPRDNTAAIYVGFERVEIGNY